jgi:hypothetical protein
MVFECDHQLFEIILTACSPKEGLEWRSRVAERACKEAAEVYEHNMFTTLSLGIKSMGTVFGKPGKSTQAVKTSLIFYDTVLNNL